MAMSKNEFNAMLKDVGLSKKQFSDITGYAYSTVASWGGPDKPVPSWVGSWLSHYKKSVAFDEAKKIFCDETSSK